MEPYAKSDANQQDYIWEYAPITHHDCTTTSILDSKRLLYRRLHHGQNCFREMGMSQCAVRLSVILLGVIFIFCLTRGVA